MSRKTLSNAARAETKSPCCSADKPCWYVALAREAASAFAEAEDCPAQIAAAAQKKKSSAVQI
jgi:hypothetical protein